MINNRNTFFIALLLGSLLGVSQQAIAADDSGRFERPSTGPEKKKGFFARAISALKSKKKKSRNKIMVAPARSGAPFHALEFSKSEAEHQPLITHEDDGRPAEQPVSVRRPVSRVVPDVNDSLYPVAPKNRISTGDKKLHPIAPNHLRHRDEFSMPVLDILDTLNLRHYQMSPVEIHFQEGSAQGRLYGYNGEKKPS